MAKKEEQLDTVYEEDTTQEENKPLSKRDIQHNNAVDKKIKKLADKNRHLIICDIIMLLLWGAGLISLIFTQFLVAIICFALLLPFTFTNKTINSFEGLPVIAAYFLAIICAPFVAIIDIIKIKIASNKIKNLEKEKVR